MAQGKCTYVLVKLTLTLTFSLADVSKNSKPNESANCFPRSNEITLSSSISHLLPTKTTCALSHEYVFIWVHLVTTIVSWRWRVNGNGIRRKREKNKINDLHSKSISQHTNARLSNSIMNTTCLKVTSPQPLKFFLAPTKMFKTKFP